MKIREVLARKGGEVKSIAPEASIEEAIRGMVEAGIGALMVIDREGAVVGIISERDCMRATAADASQLGKRRVAEVMTRELVVADAEEDVNQVGRLMRDRNCRHIPIISEGRLCGILSMRDVMRERLEETRTELEHLRNYIGGQA
ncbi:MAG: CBS domain-containing protein [Planctomycetes bacterium]|nr:CBS domain-containing protein [Planctomycetota bacterium]